MCGIAGILSQTNRPPERRMVEKMTDAIAHRGPDGQGIFVDGPVALGHRRLSIIDLEGGSQPMHSADGHSHIVFNGEIYNYPELRRALAADGYPFQSHSDTEVILALYQVEGEAGFEKLAGMFAFALWDSQQKCLFLVRDRAGMKPFYFAQANGQFVFASEIKAVRAALPQTSELDGSALNFYFARQYIGGAGTIFQKIKKVKPGTWLRVGVDGSFTEKKYWQLSPSPPQPTSPAAAEHRMDELLRQSVRSHLIADVPVGVFLSGGVDSGCLLSYAVEESSTQLQTFTVGFGDNPELDEAPLARSLAAHFGTEHHEIRVAAQEVLDCLPNLIQQLDQPLADYAVLPTFLMSKFAASQVKVVLSGEGADEVFGGYKRYQPYVLADRLPFGKWANGRLPGPSVFSETDREQLLVPGLFIHRSALPQEQQILADKKYFAPAGQLNSMLYADSRNWLVDDLLMKVDNMGMLASLEARIPYLDHRVVEYAAQLDGRLKMSFQKRKILLRNVAAKRLPAAVFNRPKHGFTVPVGDWLRGALRSTFEAAVLHDPANEQWLNLDFVKKRFAEHLAGKNHRLQLWAILVFCLWRREHF